MTREEWDELKSRNQINNERLEWPQFIAGLPDTLPEPITLYVTGGLALNGFTVHDFDFWMDGDETVRYYTTPLNKIMFDIFSKPAGVGNWIRDEEPPATRIKLYENGVLLDREMLTALVVVQPTKIPQRSGPEVRFEQFMSDMTARIEAIENMLNITH